MSERWVITRGEEKHYRNSEAEAVSFAKDMLVDERSAAGEIGWNEHVEPIEVSRVIYESRACNFQEPTPKQRRQGFKMACDFQMYPLEEDDEGTPVEVMPIYDRASIPCSVIEELTLQFAKAVAGSKDKAIWDVIRSRMDPDEVSAYMIDDIRWYEEDTPCEDGFIRWRAKGPRVWGTLWVFRNPYIDCEAWAIVDTDNFGGDYPNEKFLKADSMQPNGHYETTLNPDEAHHWGDARAAVHVAGVVNVLWGEMSPRFLKVVQLPYELQPGFEP